VLQEVCDRRRRSLIRAGGPVIDETSPAATAEGFPYALRQTWPGHDCCPNANMCRTPKLVAIGKVGGMVVVIEEERKYGEDVWSKQGKDAERARLTSLVVRRAKRKKNKN
jgi:hypothetical protein